MSKPARDRANPEIPQTRRRPLRWVWLFLLFSPSALFGQKLHLTTAAGSPGESVAIEISFQPPVGGEVSTLQWEITVPAGQLEFLDESISAGPAARAAGKAVSCSVKPKAAGLQTSTCLLYGGQGAIHDGVIAVLHLKIPVGAQSGTPRLRLDHGLAVSQDLKRFPLPPVETTVKVRSGK